jgi:hypothetical protein
VRERVYVCVSGAPPAPESPSPPRSPRSSVPRRAAAHLGSEAGLCSPPLVTLNPPSRGAGAHDRIQGLQGRSAAVGRARPRLQAPAPPWSRFLPAPPRAPSGVPRARIRNPKPRPPPPPPYCCPYPYPYCTLRARARGLLRGSGLGKAALTRAGAGAASGAGGWRTCGRSRPSSASRRWPRALPRALHSAPRPSRAPCKPEADPKSCQAGGRPQKLSLQAGGRPQKLSLKLKLRFGSRTRTPRQYVR